MTVESAEPSPTDMQALLQAGFACLSRGELKRASGYCQQALAQQPDLVQAHFLVALVGLEMEDRSTAFNAFMSVTRLQPDHPAAWAHLAKLYMRDGQVNLADAALANAEKCNSQDPMVLDLMGTVYSLLGDYEAAGAHYTQAVIAEPRRPPFLLNLANNFVYRGESEKAEVIYQKVLQLQPTNPQAHFSLASARKATDAKHIQQLDKLLAKKGLSARAAAFLYYAMGKELEDLQQWEPAFETFRRGALARRQTVEFDEAAEIDMYETLERVFTPEWLQAQPPGNRSSAPIFVLGQPRTGTTLIERIISSHSQVHSAGELQHFGLAVRRLSQHADPRRFTSELFEKAVSLPPVKIGSLYLESTRKMQGDTPYFIDKLPQNFLLIPLILAALPNAKIVHLTRDPMDACFASFKQLFADAYLHSYDQQEMARHHMRYRHLMNVWRERFGERIFDISYEATARELEPNARALLNHLGLPWEDACLEFHSQAGGVATASAAQVREPAHTRSIGRWRRYEQQLAPMREILLASSMAEENSL